MISKLSIGKKGGQVKRNFQNRHRTRTQEKPFKSSFPQRRRNDSYRIM
jgi:hypothetical protein